MNGTSNEEPHCFPTKDNHEIEKINWRNWKIFFSRTTGPISTKPGTQHPWVKGIYHQINTDLLILKKEIYLFFSLNRHYCIIIALRKCVFWLELVSQVSDQVCGPLVPLNDFFTGMFIHICSFYDPCLINHIWEDRCKRINRIELWCNNMHTALWYPCLLIYLWAKD